MVTAYRDVEVPVELHVTIPELFRRWYRRFVELEELREA